MEQYAQIMAQLEDELDQISKTPEPVLEKNRLSIKQCRVALIQLRQLVVEVGFSRKQDEIRFFKEMKPSVCSKLIFYQSVLHLEGMRLELDADTWKKYLERKRKKILKFVKKNQESIRYYRFGYKYFDEKYFLRANQEVPLEVKDYLSLMDEDFFTWYDLKFSHIKANELLLGYVSREMIKLNHSSQEDFQKSPLKWTGNKIDLYELIYSIYFDGSVNDGKVTIKDLVRAFEWMFNVDLQKGVYKTQDQLESRADPVKYLSHLESILRRRIYQKLQ